MQRLEFCQKALREKISPESVGTVTARIRRAARVLKWSVSRTKDVWYADYRVNIHQNELDAVEKAAGITHERNEVREVRDAIKRADALLEHEDETVRRAFASAISTFVSLLDRPRAAR